MRQLAASVISVFLFQFGWAQCPNGGSLSGIELIANGNLSAGNVSFSSDYIYCNSANCIYTEGLYAVGSNPNYFHGSFYGVDHTTGSGNLMIVNGAPTANQHVWCQTVSVLPFTTYVFSYWLSSMYISNAAQLQVTFNGVLSGNIFVAPNSLYTWWQYSLAWNSGNNTSIDICIINQNTAIGGNVFGLDDMSFQQCLCSSQFNANAGADVTICAGDTT